MTEITTLRGSLRLEDQISERGKNGKEHLADYSLLEIASNPWGRTDTWDYSKNEITVLRDDGKVVEFMGMPKGGKSKHIRELCTWLVDNERISEIYRRPIKIAVFKPNSRTKIFYIKTRDSRETYNKGIIHHHGTVLCDLHLHPKELSGASKVKMIEVDLAILDRGPTDDVVWCDALYDYKDLISNNARDEQKQIAGDLQNYVHLAIGINVPPEVAMEREPNREGNVMTLPFLRKIHPYYQALTEQEKRTGQPEGLDTSYHGIDGTADFDYNHRDVRGRVVKVLFPQNPEELEYIVHTA